MASVIVCDAPSCGEIIGAGEDWVDVSSVLVRDRPPAAQKVGGRMRHFHVRCCPDGLAPVEGEVTPGPPPQAA